MRILTIGGYGLTEAAFLGALQEAGVDTFVDIRQRRGVRGARYAYLNRSRLRTLLAAAGIRYFHVLDLAPTTRIRDAQREDDRASGVPKRSRTQLSPAFVQRYRAEILARLNIERLRSTLRDATTVALFCVENPPSACHRSLAAEYLKHALGSEGSVRHLVP